MLIVPSVRPMLKTIEKAVRTHPLMFVFSLSTAISTRNSLLSRIAPNSKKTKDRQPFYPKLQSWRRMENSSLAFRCEERAK